MAGAGYKVDRVDEAEDHAVLEEVTRHKRHFAIFRDSFLALGSIP